ncbi:hypothetical protein HDU97_005551 [Phlyctochytrium planicorne]|nr:hypothetical protein HDU97_005551 [Phlyctochytrium planicorne]
MRLTNGQTDRRKTVIVLGKPSGAAGGGRGGGGGSRGEGRGEFEVPRNTVQEVRWTESHRASRAAAAAAGMSELPRLPGQNPPKELLDADNYADAAGSHEHVPMNFAANGGDPEKFNPFDLERLGKVYDQVARWTQVALDDKCLKVVTNTVQKSEESFCMG